MMSSPSLEELTNQIESRTLESFGHLVAGGASGAIALFLLYPIEQLNTRSTIKSDARIISPSTIIDDFIHLRCDNISDIYRGLSFGLFEKFSFLGVYFFFYSLLKNDWLHRYGNELQVTEMPMAVALLRGSIAGILTQIFTSPLSTIQRILQTSHPEDSRNASASRIVRNLSIKHGFRALWSGFGMSMILVINPAINMYGYEYFSSYISSMTGSDSCFIDFVAGLLSKSIATIICYPLIYIKYNQQAANNATTYGESKCNVRDIVTSTWTRDGAKGFYKGIKTKLLLSSLNDALMFMIKEKVIIYTFALILWCLIRDEGPHESMQHNDIRARQRWNGSGEDINAFDALLVIGVIVAFLVMNGVCIFYFYYTNCLTLSLSDVHANDTNNNGYVRMAHSHRYDHEDKAQEALLERKDNDAFDRNENRIRVDI